MRGVEALIRWIEPDGTMVPPNEFIPLAEELGLIELIGDWVVRELVYQAAAWRELDMQLEIGFNLSPRQFWQPDLAERVLSQIIDGGVDPSTVLVEITETSAMMDPDRAQQVLWDLHDGGLRIAIDDFGTGYSSLSRLREMPVDVLKIDRSFVRGVDRTRRRRASCRRSSSSRGGLEMETLAEGIETEGELAFLRERGCRLGQGFLFARPVPPEEIIAYAFGGVPLPAGMRTADSSVASASRGLRPPEPARTASTIASASMPAQARSSSGVPEPGMSRTASFVTRPANGPVAASASRTASPRPPSTR